MVHRSSRTEYRTRLEAMGARSKVLNSQLQQRRDMVTKIQARCGDRQRQEGRGDRVSIPDPWGLLEELISKIHSDIKSDAHLSDSCHQRFNQIITETRYTSSSSLVFLSLESNAEPGRKVVHEPSKITFKILCSCNF